MITLDATSPRHGRWVQPFADLLAPAPTSDWFRQVAHLRVFAFDRIRPFLTRLMLLAVIAVCIAALPEVSWVAWVLLVPALVQGGLEILFEPYVRVRDADRWPAVVRYLRPAMRWWASVYERRQLNLTGLIGTVAVVANVVACAFLTTADESTGWIKVAAFGCAVLYANSGVAGPVLESTSYSERSSRGSHAAGRLRPAYWVLVLAAAAGVVRGSDALDRWPGSAVPYAYLACGLAYALGLRVREHDRLVAAGGLLAQASEDEGATSLARGLHDLVSPRRALFRRIMEVDGVAPGDRIQLAGFVEDLDYLRAKSHGLRIDESLVPDVRTRVAQTCRAGFVELELDIDLIADADGPGSLHKVTVDFARDVVSTLVLNAVQAYERAEAEERQLGVRAERIGQDVVLSVTDGLPLVPDEVWEEPGGNLRNVRATLRDRGGDLRQIPRDGGGKTIEARWPDTYRPLLDMDEES